MNRRPSRSRVSHDRWLVSYADFVTLLFAFFVVLYAFAKTNQHKQVQMSESINQAFRSMGLFPDAARRPLHLATASGQDRPVLPMNIVMGEEVLAPAQVKNDLDHIRHDLLQTLSGQVAAHTVAIHMGRDGLVISLREAGFFNSGSATPKPASVVTLREIAERLGRTPYNVRIEGYTDNVPIHNAQFASNLELSVVRATNIAELFLKMKVIPPQRLSAAGYGQYHPVASNDTPEGRAENRRVDLVVLPRTEIDFAAPAKAPDNGGGRKITRRN
jgi:chemotaxis protein MotB